MMKTAVIGTGKTGSRVVDLLGSECTFAFDSNNPPTVEKLKEVDVAIIFVPGDSVEQVLDTVLESRVPAVWGSTGHNWPENIPKKVKVAGTRWIVASNFSLGMYLMRKCLNIIGKGTTVLEEPEFHIHEVHHAHKKDAPSGTALSWKEWLGKDDVHISSKREGDVTGIHSLHVNTKFESLHLKHEAHDRALFAQGAIWAARFLTDNDEIMPGMYSFESILDQAFADL